METITVNGNTVEWNEGMTVGDVLTVMNYTFRMLVIKVNGSVVKKDNWNTCQVPEGADVKVIHLMSGG